jgi:hypothetical protein
MNEPLDVLRPYLAGRAAYRRGNTAAAAASYARALDLDSTFALAALDLATATTTLLRQRVCYNYECRWRGVLAGLDESGNDALFDRAFRLAWQSRAMLDARDSVLLEALRSPDTPPPRGARDVIAAFERAAAASPDRSEIRYLLALLLMYRGPAVGRSDALTTAEALLNQAIALDSGYLAPRARLVDVVAYKRDQEKLMGAGREYLAHDSIGSAADYVRWRVAAGRGDVGELRKIRARFASLDEATLKLILNASVTSGVAIDDADRAAILTLRRAADPYDRLDALYMASRLALTRGRPRQADSLLRLRMEIDSMPQSYWTSTVLAALFGDGDTAVAQATAAARAKFIAFDTVSKTHLAPEFVHEYQQGLWEWAHGRMKEAEALTRWLHKQRAERMYLVDAMLIATSRKDSNAAALRAYVDASAIKWCCAPPHTAMLSLADAYELAGDDAAALAAIRRAKSAELIDYLPRKLRAEGRLAARLGDRAGAIRAYQHYLVLRSDPEPVLRPQRDSVAEELERLRRAR